MEEIATTFAQKSAVVLMGIKHCGKSTQGRLLAKQFSCSLYDSDDVITEMTGKTPRELYTQSGEAAFMAAEASACNAIAASIRAACAASADAAGASMGDADTTAPFATSAIRAVVATGGGICKNEQALAALRAVGLFVFLNADEKTAYDRIVREIGIAENGALTNLPAYIAKENPQSLNDVRESFHRFFVARTARYNALSDITVLMDATSPEENMQRLITALQASGELQLTP